jgi:hypothetical protein
MTMEESTDAGDTAQRAVFILGIDVEFDITEDVAALMRMKESITCAD